MRAAWYNQSIMSWQLLTIITVVAMSVSILLRRALLARIPMDPYAYAVVFQLVTGGIMFGVAGVHGIAVPDIARYWPVMILTFIGYALANIVMAQAMRSTEASVFSILFATIAVWIMIGSYVFLGDRLSLVQAGGVGLILLGIFTLAERRSAVRVSRGTWLSLATAGLLGMATIGWVYVARDAEPITWTAMTFVVPGLSIALLRPRTVRLARPLLRPAVLLKFAAIGVAMNIVTLSSIEAFRLGNANLIGALQQTNIILTTLLAALFLHERSRLGRKLLAAAICLAGVLLIV